MKSKSLSTLFSSILFLGFLASSGAFAQGVFEGSGEVADPNCVGDGCGYVDPNQVQSAEQASEGPTTEQDNDATDYGTASDADSTVAQQDSTAMPQDSAEAPQETARATVNIDEEEDANYINDNADEYRARKEGFSRGIQFGLRLGGGLSKSFGDGSENWNLGFEGTGGLMANLPLTGFISVATELDFTYRHYSYEEDEQYGHNEATIDEFLFEIPVMTRYYFDEDGLFIALGINLGLKMSGETEFTQEIETKGIKDNDTRSNTLPTAGVEVGGIFDIGYTLSHWFMVDLRVVQNFTNTLDLDYAAESALMHTKLYTMHITAGITLLL